MNERITTDYIIKKCCKSNSADLVGGHLWLSCRIVEIAGNLIGREPTWLQHARGCATPNDADESRAGWQTDAAVDAKWPGRPRRADDGTLEARENVRHVLILARCRRISEGRPS